MRHGPQGIHEPQVGIHQSVATPWLAGTEEPKVSNTFIQILGIASLWQASFGLGSPGRALCG